MTYAWCVKDEEGTLRPMAGCWTEDDAGMWKVRIKTWMNTSAADGCTVVRIEIKEV